MGVGIAKMDSTSFQSSLKFMDAVVHVFFTYVTLVNLVIDLPPFQYCYFKQKVISFYGFYINLKKILLLDFTNIKLNQSRYRPRSGPEDSRKLRFPDFMTTALDGGKVVSLTHRPPLPPGNTPGTHFG
jgi:hypothetical protein